MAVAVEVAAEALALPGLAAAKTSDVGHRCAGRHAGAAKVGCVEGQLPLLMLVMGLLCSQVTAWRPYQLSRADESAEHAFAEPQ